MIFKKQFIQGVLGPDPTDIQDYQLSSIAPTLKRTELKENLDFRSMLTPVGRQNYGTCTIWGTGHQKQFFDRRQYGKEIDLSKKFAYHNMKVLSGIWFTQGDYIRNAFRSWKNFGAPLTEDYPDTPEKSWYEYAHKVPSAELYKKALKYRLGSYWSVGKTLEDFMSAQQQFLAPVVTGMLWYESYDKTAPDGKLPLPSGKPVGGHCFDSAGWQYAGMEMGKLWFENSYGENWGKKGYFYIPFKEFNAHQIWNAWLGLDYVPPKPLTGYVAMDYLRPVVMKHNSVVKTTDNLNVRETPAGKKVGKFKSGSKVVVLDDEPVKAKFGSKTYLWQKVKLDEGINSGVKKL